jgi:hypothetical protein
MAVYISTAPAFPELGRCLGYIWYCRTTIVWDMLNFHWLIPKCWHTYRVANLEGFPQNLVIFYGLGNQGILG